MSEIHKDNNDEIAEVKPIVGNPPILDKVQYAYVSYAQLAINSMDFRIAFGDRLPPDGSQVTPVVGVIMSHDLARALLVLLEKNIPRIDAVLTQRKRQVDTQQESGS